MSRHLHCLSLSFILLALLAVASGASASTASSAATPSFTAHIHRYESKIHKNGSLAVADIATDGRNIATDTVTVRHISRMLRVDTGDHDGPSFWQKDPAGYSYDLLHTSRRPGAIYDHVWPGHHLELAARKSARIGARACVVVTVKATDGGTWSKVVGPKKLCWTIAR